MGTGISSMRATRLNGQSSSFFNASNSASVAWPLSGK
jgi:hypothetical protein